jgi:chemotaxis protein MotA
MAPSPGFAPDLTPIPTLVPELDATAPDAAPRTRFDISLLLGIFVAIGAIVIAIAITGLSARAFFQPTSILIVVGGSVGVMLITTPRRTLSIAMRRSFALFTTRPGADREELVAEILVHAQAIRLHGVPAIESAAETVSQPFLRDALTIALDVTSRYDLQAALEARIRAEERQSETAAKVLDTAGGLTPTLGVLGTVVGLIDVLRQFSSVNAVAFGVGAAFTSTFYGLALANILLLPAAHRIRAVAAETFETQELMMEGALCLFEGLHPRQIRQRLNGSLKPKAVAEIETDAA